MFRFTIRDLLWLMVVVGCLLGWWIDRTTQSARTQERLDRQILMMDNLARQVDWIKPGWRGSMWQTSPRFETEVREAKERQTQRWRASRAD